MRFHFAGAASAKTRAKTLARVLSGRVGRKVSLASCQSALALSTGYSSFAELLKVASEGRAPSPSDEESDGRTVAERRDALAAALVLRLGVDEGVALLVARDAGVAVKLGSGTPGFQDTLSWPVRYAPDVIRGVPPEGLESFDFALEGLPPGRTVVGSVDAVDYLIAGTAVGGADPHVMVRWATRQEVLDSFPPETWEEDNGEVDEMDAAITTIVAEDEAEAEETLREFCHPSQLGVPS